MSFPSRYRLFAILCLVSVVLWAKALLATVTLALHNDGYTHILVIVPISALLVVLSWRNNAWTPTPSPLLGSTLLLLAVLIGVAGLWGWGDIFTPNVRLTIEMSALVVWWIGAFVVCFGSRIFRRCAFPLLFLFCLVPMPEFMLQRVVEFLQRSTASCARAMFVLSGVPVMQNGTAVTIPGLTVEVAQECSSIRSSMMLIVSSMVMAYVLLRSFWGRTLVVLAAIPLSIAKNGLRVFVLAALGAYVDQGILKGPLHHQGGIVFFAIGMAGVLATIWMVSKVERARIKTPAGTRLHCLSTSGSQ